MFLDIGITGPSSDQQSAAVPSALHFIPSFIKPWEIKNERCFTVHYHSISDDLLLGCADGMKIFSKRTGKVTHEMNYPGAAVTEYSGDVFISLWFQSEKTVKVYMYNMNNKRQKMLFSFSQKEPSYLYLSASAQYVALIGKDNNNIKLCNRRSVSDHTKQASDLKVEGLKMIGNLLFLPDGCLLVTGHDNVKDMINKYSIVSEEEEPVLIWSCDQVPGACGIAVDGRGLIYVSGQKNKTLYILSAEGKYITIKITIISYYVLIMINHKILIIKMMCVAYCRIFTKPSISHCPKYLMKTYNFHLNK